MKALAKIISRVIVVEAENVDTDQIIPARFLKTTSKDSLGKYLFYNWKNKDTGIVQNKGAAILLARNNFGCGSSREHAVWALMDYGFRVIISSGFGDIFYNNCLKNGLLCIKLKESEIKELFGIIKKNPNTFIKINLESQTVAIVDNKKIFHFEIDPFRKSYLIMGVDELGYILAHEDKITAYEKNI